VTIRGWTALCGAGGLPVFLGIAWYSEVESGFLDPWSIFWVVPCILIFGPPGGFVLTWLLVAFVQGVMDERNTRVIQHKGEKPMREHILALLAHKPFMPFRIYLTDRSVHEIRGPEFAEVRESVMDLKEPDPDAPGGMSWRCTLALRHVVSIEVPMVDAPTVVGGEERPG
jgi:hypothetical protein